VAAELVVERAGSQTLVVDRGRFGYRHEGIAWCGPADALAFDVANALTLDNGAALLEIMLGDARFRFTDARAFALTGADCDASLDGKRCAAWAKHVAHPGSVLTLRVPARGVFSYVSVSGGIDVPPVLGSRATDRVAGIGGFEGRALRAGDRLTLGAPRISADAPFAVAPPERRSAVRVLAGGEFDRFDEQSQALLWSTAWRVGHESNRMGFRLHGACMRYAGNELSSHAVFPGVIQIPPGGEPIVLLSDAHTTGGYPKAGVAIAEDLRIVAQSRPGECVRFSPVGPDEASEASRRRQAYLQALGSLARERSGR
jgi:5-oxoprolinase (ATP-hydrolysing) subunit C